MKLGKHVLWMTLAAATMAVAQQDPPGRVGRLSYATGSVSFQPGGVDEWVNANVNRPLTTGDHLWVDQNSRAEVQIGTAVLRMNSGTAFEFLNLDDQNVQVRLAQGSLEIRVRYLDENQAFEVDTPNVAFSLLRPGVYRVDANPDAQSTIVTVRSGQAEATGGGQAFQLRPRESAQVTGDQQITYNIVGAPMPDWFDNWADGRDRREQQSQSSRYVSHDMIGYEDLDAAGSWRSEPEYGSVWYPRGVQAGWAPYRDGHWAWIEPWGWTWVDDEPWGFAPFHYGRWAYIGDSWGWIPGPLAVRPVYAPALVAFIGGPHFNLSIGIGGGGGLGVGWFPLGPHEVYVPSYRASEGYVNRVNVTNTVINNNVNITNIYNNTNTTNVRYVNQNAPNGVTAVSRDTFVGARSVRSAQVAVRPEMLAQAQVVRTAAFAPTAQAVVGRANVTTNVARPPAAVVSRAVVARATPPPPPVPFVQRQAILQQNPGRPLAAQEVQQIRAQNPRPVQPTVRQMPAAHVGNGGQPNGQPAQVFPRNQPGNPGQPANPTVAPVPPQGRFERPVQTPQPNVQPPAQNAPQPVRPNVPQPSQNAPQPNVPRTAQPEPTPAPQPRVQQPPPQQFERPAQRVEPAPAPQPRVQQPPQQFERPAPRVEPAPAPQPRVQQPPQQFERPAPRVEPAPAPQPRVQQPPQQFERPAQRVEPAPAPQPRAQQPPPPAERPAPRVQPERQVPHPPSEQPRVEPRPAQPVPQERQMIQRPQPPPARNERPEPPPKEKPKEEKKDEKK